jgi:hypothetical protein
MIRALHIAFVTASRWRDSMPSLTTIYRAGVMIAVGAIAYKGWQLYGPPTEKVKSVATRAVDMAQTAWNNYRSSGKDVQPAPAPRGSAPPLAQTLQPPATEGAIVPPPLSTQTLTPSPPAGAIPSTSAPMTQAPITPLAQTPPATATEDDRVKTLMSRLQQLGGSDPKVAPWGSGGHLFRCCCQAPLANSSAVTQHFESVATEPALAVEQVVAKVEAWRTAQRNGGILRY